MTATRRFLGFTWIGWVNMLVVQWTGLRLYRVEGPGGRIVELGLHGWVLPLTGWRSPFFPKAAFVRPLWRAA